MSVERFIPGRPAADSDPAVSGTPTLAELWRVLRLDGEIIEGSDGAERLEWARALAIERADRQAPDAPAAVRRMAITLGTGWLFEGHQYNANFWVRCGANSCLKPWTIRRAGAIG